MPYVPHGTKWIGKREKSSLLEDVKSLTLQNFDKQWKKGESKLLIVPKCSILVL